MKAPFAVERRVLKGGVGTCVVRHSEHRGIIRQGARVGPDPLAHGKVPVPVGHVHFGIIVVSVVPKTPSVRAGTPIGCVHTIQRQICTTDGIGGRTSTPVLKGPVVLKGAHRWHPRRGDRKGRRWDNGFAEVRCGPRHSKSVRSISLVKFHPQVVHTFAKVDPSACFTHAVHAMVLDDGYPVHPQFRAVVAVKVKRPISRPRNVDQTAESSTPIHLEPVVKSCVGVVRHAVVEVCLDLSVR